MAKAIDITGLKVGMLTVLERAGGGGAGQAMWWVQCECGAKTIQGSQHLRSGNAVSCGCVKKSVHASVQKRLRSFHKNLTRGGNWNKKWNEKLGR